MMAGVYQVRCSHCLDLAVTFSRSIRCGTLLYRYYCVEHVPLSGERCFVLSAFGGADSWRQPQVSGVSTVVGPRLGFSHTGFRFASSTERG